MYVPSSSGVLGIKFYGRVCVSAENGGNWPTGVEVIINLFDEADHHHLPAGDHHTGHWTSAVSCW